jgi:phenylalanyl-tRNA synthetase alpha chain
MREQLLELRQKAEEQIQSASNTGELNEIRVKYLGKKGELTQILRGMGGLSPEERPLIGQLANEIRDALDNVLEERGLEIKSFELAKQLEEERIDVTMPGQTLALGNKHPLTIVLDSIKNIFLNLGFEIAEGPEVETDYYNFEALNLPQDHPARDMQDSFYITENFLLRTHTSPVQARVMERTVPDIPIRIISPGRVYRRDAIDNTHSPMFQQVEGLVIDKSVTFAELKGTLIQFIHEIFGQDREVRFRPSFFPFTEPSAEVDVSCNICDGEGCRTCGHTGWLEILGAGMVHPRVLEMAGYDPEQVSGFAFGMGVERIAILKYGIDDIRLFFENDLRFLKQF